MVKRVIHFVYQEVRGLHQAAYILALFAFGSQLLAIVRDRLLAHTFGAGVELDVYYAAFRVPDLLYVLFASVLSVYVLLPFVRRQTECESIQSGMQVISQVFTIFLVGYAFIAFVLVLAAPLYAPLLFPGFSDYPTLVKVTQILLIQPLFLGISSLCGVVTQMNHRFVLYAVSPLLYNVGIIIGIIALYPFFGLVGLALGVVVGAIGHLIIQVPYVIRSEYRFGVTQLIDWKLIREVLSVSVPRALTLSVGQFVFLILIGMASLMTAGSVSVFQFAYNLQSVPLAIVGMSYSVAAFPTLSLLFARNDQAGFNVQLLTALRHIIFWSIPIISLVIVLRAQIVRVLLGSGEFDWSDTRLTAAVLAIFVISLTAQAILLLITRAFYACGRTITPLIIALGSAVIALFSAHLILYAFQTSSGFQYVLERAFRLTSVPGTEVLVLVCAFVVGQLLQTAILLVVSKKTFSISYRSLGRLTLQAVLAAVAGGVAAYGALSFIVDGVNQNTFLGILLQGTVAGLLGLTVIVGVYWLLRSPELAEVVRSFHTKIFKTDVIAPEETAP